MKHCVVLAALPVLLRPVVFAYPNTYQSNDILTYRGLTEAVPIEAREIDPYAKTDLHQRSLSGPALSEHELAMRDVYEILKGDPAAAILARDLFARNPKIFGKSKTNTGEGNNGIKPEANKGHSKIKAGAEAAKHYLKSPTNDLGLAGDVLSFLPVPGVEEAGLVMKGASMAEKADKVEKVGKAAEYARKGRKAAHKVSDGVGKANDLLGKAQDFQSNVQNAQQVAGQVKQSMQRKKDGQGKDEGQKQNRRALDAIVFARQGW
ncbi:hypothetical protein MMC17_005599 [Xylographa soralifera]|nr:hypothetical protein [Xylographa soralifera]